jgi:prepilin signal peptidase PulO-like enzyme (type II secretory pathway)
MTAPLLFLIGLAIGSFLNVLVFRYFPDESLFCNVKKCNGRSKCMACDRTLRWYELIPIVSFFAQLGRCRGCKSKISWQYPLMELACGFVFLLPYFFKTIPELNNIFFAQPAYFLIFNAIWILIFLSFVAIFAIDRKFYIIPDGLNIFLAGLGTLLVAENSFYANFSQFGKGSFLASFSMLFGARQDIWLNHFIGALVALVVIGSIILFTRGKGMGIGDLKFAVALGIIFGWPDIIFILAFSFITGSIFGIYLLLKRVKGLKDSVPFGPFLVLGALILMFFGQTILNFYFNIF